MPFYCMWSLSFHIFFAAMKHFNRKILHVIKRVKSTQLKQFTVCIWSTEKPEKYIMVKTTIFSSMMIILLFLRFAPNSLYVLRFNHSLKKKCGEIESCKKMSSAIYNWLLSSIFSSSLFFNDPQKRRTKSFIVHLKRNETKKNKHSCLMMSGTEPLWWIYLWSKCDDVWVFSISPNTKRFNSDHIFSRFLCATHSYKIKTNKLRFWMNDWEMEAGKEEHRKLHILLLTLVRRC